MNIVELYGNKQIVAFVNLNAIIYVKLNKEGLNINNSKSESYKLKVDEGGYVKVQLWKFMQSFAPHMVVGTSIIESNTMLILPEENCLQVKTFAQIEEECNNGTERGKQEGIHETGGGTQQGSQRT